MIWYNVYRGSLGQSAVGEDDSEERDDREIPCPAAGGDRRVSNMTALRTNGVRTLADWLGIAASTACAAHCILIPVLLVTGTVLPASFLGGESFHLAMLWMILPAAIVAFGIGCWRHKDRWVLAFGIIGLAGMVLSVTVVHELAGELGERITTVLSAAVLILAHYRNFQLCRSSGCAHESG